MRPRPESDAVLALADELLRAPARWGPMGVEFAFFHQFVNPAFHQELGARREELYGSTEPPMPRNLAGASALLPGIARAKSIDLPDLLLAPFSSDADRATMRPVAEQASDHLTGFARRSCADPGSLHLALLCGTPPIPADVQVSQTMLRVPPAGCIPAIAVRIFSAKVLDIKVPYADATDRLSYARPSTDLPPIETYWRDTFPPCVELLIVPYGDQVPRPSQVQQCFKAARQGQHFYDSRTRVNDLAREIETWTLATLRLRCGLGTRAAMRLWAGHRGLEDPFIGHLSKTATPAERVHNRQRRTIYARIVELRRLLDA